MDVKCVFEICFK